MPPTDAERSPRAIYLATSTLDMLLEGVRVWRRPATLAVPGLAVAAADEAARRDAGVRAYGTELLAGVAGLTGYGGQPVDPTPLALLIATDGPLHLPAMRRPGKPLRPDDPLPHETAIGQIRSAAFMHTRGVPDPSAVAPTFGVTDAIAAPITRLVDGLPTATPRVKGQATGFTKPQWQAFQDHAAAVVSEAAAAGDDLSVVTAYLAGDVGLLTPAVIAVLAHRSAWLDRRGIAEGPLQPSPSAVPAADHDPAPTAPPPRGNPGRKVVGDVTADEQLLVAVEASGLTPKEYAAGRGMDYRRVRDACNRARTRRVRGGPVKGD